MAWRSTCPARATRLSKADDLPGIAVLSRGLEPAQLEAGRSEGTLDLIVMKALEKDHTRR